MSDKNYHQNYEPSTGHQELPLQILNNPIDTGYAVKTKHKGANDSKTWSGMLITNNNNVLKLWIEDVVMDFSMSGSAGQSRYRKQFYPKAFNQPTMKVSGRMPNQFEYNKLASFIRESHFDALNQVNRNIGEVFADNKYDTNTIRFFIKGTSSGTQTQPKRNLKGNHLPLGFRGYIKNIAAGATKFEFAPQFKFDFVIASSVDTGQVGIYSDTLDLGTQIMSWMDLFKKYHFSWKAGQPMLDSGKVSPPDFSDQTSGDSLVDLMPQSDFNQLGPNGLGAPPQSGSQR